MYSFLMTTCPEVIIPLVSRQFTIDNDLDELTSDTFKKANKKKTTCLIVMKHQQNKLVPVIT